MSKRCIHCKSGHVSKTASNEWTCFECLSKWGRGKKRTQPVFECNNKSIENKPFVFSYPLVFPSGIPAVEQVDKSIDNQPVKKP